MQCALKTMEPAIEFRRESDLFAEQLGKATAAEAGLSGHFEDAPNVWSPSKFLKRILDGRMQFEPRVHSSQKRDFELAELVGGSGRFSQAVAQRVGHRTPNKIERYAFVVKRVGERVQECTGATRSKEHSDCRLKCGGINHTETRLHPDDQGRGARNDPILRRAILEPRRVRKVNYQLKSPIRKHTFFAMNRRIAFAVP